MLNAEGQPTTVTTDFFQMEVWYNADGSFNYEIRDEADLVHAGDYVELDPESAILKTAVQTYATDREEDIQGCTTSLLRLATNTVAQEHGMYGGAAQERFWTCVQQDLQASRLMRLTCLAAHLADRLKSAAQKWTCWPSRAFWFNVTAAL